MPLPCGVLCVAISPYELASPSPGAAVALLLADVAITLVPSPAIASESESLEQCPRFAQLLGRWQWTRSLWDAGVLSAELDEAHPVEDVHDACQDIQSEPSHAVIRAILPSGLVDDRRARLDTLCNDLIRGGVDPGVVIPVSVGLERFAARHDLPIVRSPANSAVTTLEQRDTAALSRFALPCMLGASGRTILAAREHLASELEDVRAAVQHAVQATRVGASSEEHRDILQHTLGPAADALEDAFQSVRPVLASVADDRGDRYKPVTATITLGAGPPDAALRAASRAATALARRPIAGTVAPGGTPIAESETAIQRPAALTLTVRPRRWTA